MAALYRVFGAPMAGQGLDQGDIDVAIEAAGCGRHSPPSFIQLDRP
jgi:hypothetical protein